MFFVKEASRIVAENFSRLGVALLVFLVLGVSILAESSPCQPVIRRAPEERTEY